MFLAVYQRTSRIPVADLLRQCIREEGLTEQEIYIGRIDGKEWAGMFTGRRPLDLVLLSEILPLKVQLRFLPKYMAALVERHGQQLVQQGVA